APTRPSRRAPRRSRRAAGSVPAPAAQGLRAIPDQGSPRDPHARPPATYTIPPALLRDLAGFLVKTGLSARGAAAAAGAPLCVPWRNRPAGFVPAQRAG